MSLKPGKRIKSKTIGLQLGMMRSHFPQFKYRRARGCQIWTGTLKPSPKSPDYTVQIEYRLRHHPHVYVLSPEISPDAPHIYHFDDSLCLYHPNDGDWSSEKYIALTIVPWIVEWLRYYEIWCVTGKWFGPEASHSNQK